MTAQPKPRQKFLERRISLRNETVRKNALALISNLPVSDSRPLQMIIREEAKGRTLDANARMWVGPLTDIAVQAWVSGKQFSPEVWHEHFKREYLPEEFDPELTKDGYQKWDYTPKGERVLVGSTTQLTKRGFAEYLQKVEAFGGSLGVLFSAPKQREAA